MEQFPLWLKILYFAPPLLFAVVCHEVAHGWLAEKLGDPTARRLGRITLNPIVHVDPFMTIIFPGLLILLNSPFIFGGAKPVPVNPMNFKNPRRGMAYVAMAGPAVNFLIVLIVWPLLHLYMTYAYPSMQSGYNIIGAWLYQSIIVNLVLGIFNLLPVPPLDGGRIAVGFLPVPLAKAVSKLERFGLIIVIVLLSSGFLHTVMNPILDFLLTKLL